MKLPELQQQAQELGLPIENEEKKFTKAELTAAIEAKQAEIDQDTQKDPADVEEVAESDQGPEEPPKSEAPEPAKKKSEKKESVLDLAHFNSSVEGKDKLFPFSPHKLPFDKSDVVVVGSGKNQITVCLTPLRRPEAMGLLASYLNNRRGVSADQASQLIADCVLGTGKVG